MKTAGQLLQEKRLLKELTIKDLADKIKVKPEYLIALEESDYLTLPSATATKGFLRNYARVLHLNPDTLVAMFRRDFEEGEKGEIVPRGLVEPVARKPRLLSANLILAGIALFIFLGFLGFQLFSWWSLPSLKIIQPENGEVYGEKVTFRGTTDSDAVVEINGQKVLVDQNGQFTLDLIFASGTHSVVIKVENRQGKSRLEKRTFQVSK